jgi:glutathione synthase
MRVALQMDPIMGINPATDSSFLLGLGAQERGHALFVYTPRDLFWQDGKLMAHLSAVTLQRPGPGLKAGAHAQLATAQTVELAESVDVILLRQDPPFNMGYLSTTYLLEAIREKVRIVNDPTGVRNSPEKLLILPFSRFMPPTLISADKGDISAFAQTHKKVVVKKIYGHGGRDVSLFDAGDPALLAFAEEHWQKTSEPLMVQAFLPEVREGDKRIILFDGEPVGIMRRVPAEGKFLANLAQGGTAVKTEMTARDHEICAALAPALRAAGLYFVGLDIIGEHLIEVNVTSPTGLASINALGNLTGEARMEMRFWKGLGM